MKSHTDPAIARAGLARDTLAGSVAIVTGGGRGIGREAARACGWLGARVVVADLGREGGETAALIRADGGEARFLPADIADEGFVAALVAAAAETYAPADILINGAALCEAAPTAETSAALWDRTLAVNLRGPFLACRAVLPAMLERGRGVIVNLVGAEALPGLTAYSASQQGLIAFTHSLARELSGGGVRVVAMTPGVADAPGAFASPRLRAPEEPSAVLQPGLSAEQLLGASPHPAYAGAMPVEDAGAAVACLVADPSAGGRGELVSGYTILQRAGLIAPAPLPWALPDDVLGVEAARSTPRLYVPFQLGLAQHPPDRQCAADDSDELLWHELLDDLEREIAGAADDALLLNSSRPARLVMLRESLYSLKSYYARVPEETTRFTGDPNVLRRVEEACRRRIGFIADLLAAIEHP